MKEFREVMFDIYKDGKPFEGRRVGFPYIRRDGIDVDYEEKLKRLKADYPIKEGYTLMNKKDRKTVTTEDIIERSRRLFER